MVNNATRTSRVNMSLVNKYFQIAQQIASKKDDRRQYRLGAVGVRSDGAMVMATNVPCQHPQRHAHAEARLTRKLDHGSSVFVVRVLKDGTMANARPCDNCQKAMRGRGVKNCFYTISNLEYGVLVF